MMPLKTPLFLSFSTILLGKLASLPHGAKRLPRHQVSRLHSGQEEEKTCASPPSSESGPVVGKQHLGQHPCGQLPLPSPWSELGFVATSSGQAHQPRETVRADWGCVQEAVVRPGFCQSPGAVAGVHGDPGGLQKDRVTSRGTVCPARTISRPGCIALLRALA